MAEQDEAAQSLAHEFMDEEYRRTWAEDYINTSLALQIAVLRKQRGWNQSDLAAIAGTTQSAISRMEDVEYGAHSIRVLKQLAAAFGLRLRVSFEEFGALISESGQFSEQGLRRHSFQADREIARLLAAQGLVLPSPEFAAISHADDVPVGPPAMNYYPRFEDEFQAALFLPLEDRVKIFKKWLMGSGLPSAEEPAYKRLYFSIPADERHADLARRAAGACAEWLRPEGFGELLSDPIDGERAVNNVLRLSAALRAGHDEIASACGQLIPWLKDQWRTLEDTSQQAVIDLVVELGEVALAKLILAWPEAAGFSDRQRIKITRQFLEDDLSKNFVTQDLADSLQAEARRNRSDVLVNETSIQVIRGYSNGEAAANLRKSASERAAIAFTLLNQTGFVLQPG